MELEKKSWEARLTERKKASRAAVMVVNGGMEKSG